MLGLRKSYGSVRALDGAHLAAFAGEIHGVLGENGAGKSSLAHVLGGLVTPDAGRLFLHGREVRLRSPAEAAAHSIGLVHQHFKLVPALTALENIALWAVRDGWRIPLSQVREQATSVARRAGLSLDLDVPVARLGVGAKQRVEVVKLLYREPRLLVLDEPTAVLSPPEVSMLFQMLRTLAADGRTVLLIAHKLDEVLAVCDRVTVLRRGATVLEAARADVDAELLTRAMVGGASVLVPPRSSVVKGEVVAALREASFVSPEGTARVNRVDLEVQRGEIVGVAGVEGNGQRELSLLLTGRELPSAGTVTIPDHVGFVPQDRGHEGLAAELDLVENTAFAAHDDPEYRSGPLLDWERIRARTAEIVERFDVRTPGLGRPARTLSGGNQQKLVVGRETTRGSDLLVVENPTRGLDVAAAAFVHRLLLDLRARGADAPGIVLISTDLDEVLSLSDRVFVTVRGKLTRVEGDPPMKAAVGAAMLAGIGEAGQ